MKIASHLYDARIEASNVLVQMTIAEYENLIKKRITQQYISTEASEVF